MRSNIRSTLKNGSYTIKILQYIERLKIGSTFNGSHRRLDVNYVYYLFNKRFFVFI